MRTHVELLGDKYQAEIDGLRAVAVLAVVINHYWPNFITGGFVGVDIFFVISGYIITKLILREIKENKFNYLSFYIRRIKRIIPVLIVVLTLTIVFAQFLMLNSDRIDAIKASLATILFSANILYWRELQFGYFATMDTGIHPLIHTWSLAVEEQFYLLFPLFIFFIIKIKNKTIINCLIVFIILFSIYLSQNYIINKSVAVFFLSPFRFWELFFGVLIAINIDAINFNKLISEFLALIGAIFLFTSFVFFNKATKFPGFNALIPVIGTSLIIITSQTNGLFYKLNVINYILSNRILVYFGLISYSLYLIHWPLFALYRYYDGLDESDDLIIFNIFILSILLAHLSFKFIEQKFRSISIENIKLFFLGVFVIIICFIGFNLYMLKYIDKDNLTNIHNVYDSQRIPTKEYKKCDQIIEHDNWCKIGNINNTPSYLILGDSHLDSWAPAFNASLLINDKSAVIAPFSACPPLINISSSPVLGCNERSKLIKYLIENNSANHIILTGDWLHHFNQEKYKNSLIKNFEETIELIISKNIKLTIIGAVPIYKKNVPLMLALQSKQNKNQKDLIVDINAEIIKLNDYYRIIEKYKKSKLINFYEPHEKLCSPFCINSLNNKSLYSDSNHLNTYGASLFIEDFTNLIKNN